jgi:hypothetical protein
VQVAAIPPFLVAGNGQTPEQNIDSTRQPGQVRYLDDK